MNATETRNAARRIVLLAITLVSVLAGSLALRGVQRGPAFELQAAEADLADAGAQGIRDRHDVQALGRPLVDHGVLRARVDDELLRRGAVHAHAHEDLVVLQAERHVTDVRAREPIFLNDDTRPDFVVANAGSQFLSIFYGAEGGYTVALRDIPGTATTVAAADFNQDGRVDIVAGRGSDAPRLLAATCAARSSSAATSASGRLCSLLQALIWLARGRVAK